MTRNRSLLPAVVLGMLLATVLAACSAQQMQTMADTLTGMEKALCTQAPTALVAAQASQAAAVQIQKDRPGTDADKAVAAANMTVAALSQAQAFCKAKGY